MDNVTDDILGTMGVSPIRKITAQSHINNREKSLESGRYPEETDAQRNLRRRRRMIYRKWSLLSGPPVILGAAVVAAIAVGIVLQNVFSCSISFCLHHFFL